MDSAAAAAGTRCKDAVAVFLSPANHLPHLAQDDVFYQSKHRSYLVREPTHTAAAAHFSQNWLLEQRITDCWNITTLTIFTSPKNIEYKEYKERVNRSDAV